MERGRFDRVLTAVAHPDAREHLRDGIRASCAYFAAYRDVHRVLFSTAALDPEATAGAVQRGEANRTGGMVYLAQRLAEQNLLRPDLTVDDAAHILFVITSFGAFDLLYTGRDLPVDEIARLLVATAEHAVAARRPGRPDRVRHQTTDNPPMPSIRSGWSVFKGTFHSARPARRGSPGTGRGLALRAGRRRHPW